LKLKVDNITMDAVIGCDCIHALTCVSIVRSHLIKIERFIFQTQFFKFKKIKI